MRGEIEESVFVKSLSKGRFMMRSVMERRSSRETKNFAISIIDTMWPMPVAGMNTSSAGLYICGDDERLWH